MRMLRRNALSFLTCMPIAAAAGGASVATAAVPEEKPKTSGKILFVVTSHGELGNTGRKTGYWLSEVTHPWKVLKDAGYEIDFVSPLGRELMLPIRLIKNSHRIYRPRKRSISR